MDGCIRHSPSGRLHHRWEDTHCLWLLGKKSAHEGLGIKPEQVLSALSSLGDDIDLFNCESQFACWSVSVFLPWNLLFTLGLWLTVNEVWEAFMMQLDSSSDEILHWLFEFLLLMTWVQELGDAVRENAPTAQEKVVFNDSNVSDYIGNPLCFRVIIFSMSKPSIGVVMCSAWPGQGCGNDWWSHSYRLGGPAHWRRTFVIIHSLVLFGVYNLFFPPFACIAWSVCTLFQL
jgi:hypothetical protein